MRTLHLIDQYLRSSEDPSNMKIIFNCEITFAEYFGITISIGDQMISDNIIDGVAIYYKNVQELPCIPNTIFVDVVNQLNIAFYPYLA